MKCRPCEDYEEPMEKKEILDCLKQIKGWTYLESENAITKDFKFKGFLDAIDFTNKVAKIAEQENHHPYIHVKYNKVAIFLKTFAIHGLSENDFILAAKIDEIKV